MIVVVVLVIYFSVLVHCYNEGYIADRKTLALNAVLAMIFLKLLCTFLGITVGMALYAFFCIIRIVMLQKPGHKHQFEENAQTNRPQQRTQQRLNEYLGERLKSSPSAAVHPLPEEESSEDDILEHQTQIANYRKNPPRRCRNQT